MAVYTDITRDELEALLERYTLGALDTYSGIAAGVINSNFFVDTASGRCVLTVFETLGADELPYFLELTEHLAGAGIPCPRPVRARDGALLQEVQGKPAAFVQCLPGAELPAVDPAACARTGAMLARMHLAARDFGRRRANPQGLAWARRSAAELHEHLAVADRSLLAGEIAELDAQDFSALPAGVIHGDLFRDNVLFSDSSITGVIDFYYACDDVLLLDLAITVNDWCTAPGGMLLPAHTQAMLRAYQCIRPVAAAERAAWPALLRLAALRFWVSRLLDAHFPRPGSLTTVKDPEEFAVILRQRRNADQHGHDDAWDAA